MQLRAHLHGKFAVAIIFVVTHIFSKPLVITIYSCFSGANFDLPVAIKSLSAGTKLVLGAQQPPTLPDQLVVAPQLSSTPASVSEDVIAFSSVSDASEVVHSLSLIHFIIQQPICKQAFLEILRKDLSSSS